MDKSNPKRPTGDLKTSIEGLRDAIDEIDEGILDLINRRLFIAVQIGRFKKQNGIQIVDSNREKAIIDRLAARNAGPLPENALHQIFKAIMAAARDVQNK